MEPSRAGLEGARAIGRLGPEGAWIGFGVRGASPRLVVGLGDQVRDAPADADLLLAIAVAHYAQAFDEAPPDLEATQADLSALVARLLRAERDPTRRTLLVEALDGIDDGLAGDVVASRLTAARSIGAEPIEAVELLRAAARALRDRGR